MVISSEELSKRKQIEDAVAGALKMVRRKEWKAQPPVKELELDWDYNSIVIHYTGHDKFTTAADIQKFDLEHRHWDDIAYHYAVAPEGTIYEGRELVYKGSHIFKQNTGKIGIVCMGDFDANWRNLLVGEPLSGDDVKASMLDAVKRLTDALRARFPIAYFGGHMEFGDSDTCPGSKLLAKVKEMRTELGLQAPKKLDLQ